MAETAQSILIDKDLRPKYYDDFHCIMGSCQYNCCDDDWLIAFNKRDYLKIKHAPKSPEMEELTQKCMRRLREQAQGDRYAEFHSSEAGRCAFHTPEGLCRLQLECGEKTLPKVCRVFPRGEGAMPSGYLERTLSPGCEGVLSLLWDLPDGIEFCSDPLPQTQRKKLTMTKNNPLFLCFSVVREWCIDVLQNRRFTLPQRIFLMGMGLKELADGEEDIQRWMERVVVLPDRIDMANILPTGDSEMGMYLSSCIHTLLELSPTDSSGTPVLRVILEELTESLTDAGQLVFPLDSYRAVRTRYEERFAGRDYFMENLMVTIFFHLHLPHMTSRENLWKGYVNFCNLYAAYRFLSVMSCREGASGDRDELFRLIVFASRQLLHNRQRQGQLQDELFKNDSATLAHMAILLCG